MKKIAVTNNIVEPIQPDLSFKSILEFFLFIKINCTFLLTLSNYNHILQKEENHKLLLVVAEIIKIRSFVKIKVYCCFFCQLLINNF